MYNRLIIYLDKHNIISSGQFGFRANHSTAHALLLITDQIQRAIEGGHFTCGIFLDLSQAFDTVDHNTLLAKLYSYGIRGIAYDCFLSYLSNCCPFVSIGNTSSTSNPFTSGVPQGSVLGPLYIYIYINDFSNCSTVFDLHRFADDSNLFLAASSLECSETRVNQELKHVHDWFCANRLSLNIDQTNFFVFHPFRKN